MSGETWIMLSSIFATLAVGVLGAVFLHYYRRRLKPKPQLK